MSSRINGPSSTGRRLGDELLDSTDLQQEVLAETLASIEQGRPRESGRTLCASGTDEVKPPLDRDHAAVELSACPVGITATMHTHPSESELRSPTHSLPDMANVILLEDVAASMVAGVQQSEVLMEPEDREEAVAVFQDALGADVTTTMDVIDLLQRGEVADPPAVRQEVRGRLSSLFRKADTAHPSLTQRLASVGPPDLSLAEITLASHRGNPISDGDDSPSREAGAVATRVRRKHSRVARTYAQAAPTEGVNLQDLIISTVVGNVVGNVVDNFLF